jgi:hypothetical protein
MISGDATAQCGYLLLRALHLLDGYTPVDAPEKLPVGPPGLWAEMLEELQEGLVFLLADFHVPAFDILEPEGMITGGPEHGSRSPAPLIAMVRRAVCAACFPIRDLVAVMRHAKRPTDHMRFTIEADPQHWLRATALVLAACANCSEDQNAYGLAMALLADASVLEAD